MFLETGMPTLEDRKDYDNKQDNLAKYLWGLWLICMGVPLASGAVLWVLYYIGFSVPETLKDWGIVGDFIGGMSNPLISGLTFLALIMTILQNQKVLRLTEEELAETRKEIELTREANQTQAEEFRKQNELIRGQAEVDSVTQAMIRLSDIIDSEWNKTRDHMTGSTLHAYTQEHYEVMRIMAEDGYAMGKSKKRAVDTFMPFAVAYCELLLKLYADHSENPMYKAMKATQGPCLAQLKAYGHFTPYFSKENIERLGEVLEGYDHQTKELDC